MPITSSGIKAVIELVQKLGHQVVYPGIPLVLVPALLAGLIGMQFDSNLVQLGGSDPVALDLPVSLGLGPGNEPGPATLLVVPRGAQEFLIPAHEESFSAAWLSIPTDKQVQNEKRLELSPTGLRLSPLFGVRYPLAVVLQGRNVDRIEPAAQGSKDLGHLEFGSSEATWTVLFLLGAAVFGFGASAGLLKDGSIVEGIQARGDERH